VASLTIKNLTKRFGNFTAVNNLSIDVADGEFITLLGPSGCGKTTTLRVISGFLDADEGDVFFDDQRVNDLPPNKRPTAMVFQSYALFPHMTVFQNISFGPRMKKENKVEIEKKVKKALELTRLTGLEERYPKELSGGQQQRVAVARALVMHPKIILFDEPLSNLDAKLREKMRIEIRSLQKDLGITAIYVTHDQAEALVISDRVVVMNQGAIQQFDTPIEIYNHPKSIFVAGFIGIDNFIKGIIKEKIDDTTYILDSELGEVRFNSELQLDKRADILISVRPENFTFQRCEGNELKGKIIIRSYMGSFIDYHIDIKGKTIRVQTTGEMFFEEGDEVCIYFREKDCTVVENKDEDVSTR